jgi:Xaa-Pro dipeptidase
MKDKIRQSGCIFLSTNENRSDENFYYATGISKTSCLNSFAILRRGKKPLVVSSVLEYDELRKNKNIEVAKYESRKDIQKIMKTHLRGRVGINYSAFSIASLKGLKKYTKNTYDVSKLFEASRSVKTREEINKIRQACKISQEVLDEIPNILKIGMRESDLAAELEYNAKRSGAEDISFPTIVAFGSNAAVPHHVSSATKIGKNNFLLVDFGVVFDGYCSDLSRTFFIGRAGAKEKKAYSVVKRAQIAAINAARPGVKYTTLVGLTNKILTDGLNQKLIHGLGHGIGINVHDYPSGKSYSLRKGSVITVEPGYYASGAYGIRIEDDIVISDRAKMLSRSPKNLLEI